MKKLWNIWVYVFRFKRKGYTFHRGFWRTSFSKTSYVKPHWRKSIKKREP